MTGRFGGTATFGEGEANELALIAAGRDDIFVAKYDPDGALLWATRPGGALGGDQGSPNGVDQGSGSATGGRGYSYVTGRFAGTATFGEGETNETVLNAGGGTDLFVAKYDPDGALLWATRAGGCALDNRRDQGSGIATDARGNSYVTGPVRRHGDLW